MHIGGNHRMTDKYALIIDGGCKYHGAGGTLNHTYSAMARKTLEDMGWTVDITCAENNWDAATEAEKLIRARGVIVQTPIWWMSTPWQVKRYIDEVFMQPGICGGDGRTRTAPQLNYGTGGLLTGRYMISSTWNAPRHAFVTPGDFFENTGIDGVMMPLHKALQFVGLKPLTSFMANDVLKNPTHDEDFKNFVELVKKNFEPL